MSFLLNMHPEVLCIGEMGPARQFEVEGYRCSCGAVLAQCPFFLKVKNRMEERGVAFDMNRWELRYRYSARRTIERLVMGTLGSRLLRSIRDPLRPLIPYYTARMNDFERRNRAFIRAALEVSGKRVFLDATKYSSRIPLLSRIKDIDLRVIHLLRDPRAYCHSARKHQGKQAQPASREWAVYQYHFEEIRRRLSPERWMQLKYEALCADPDSHISALCDFMGVPPLGAPGDFRTLSHHIIGNKMRDASDPRSSIRLDEKWRETLSSPDLQVAARIAGRQARRYGYDL
ncbi:MAG: sulfotransferase [bacterium]|nr:sulfotransferase [bacterium]